MNPTEIAEEVQEQLLSIVQIAQENIVGALEAVAGQAQYLLPQYAVRFASRLPDAAHVVDRGFERAEQWLQQNRSFAAKVGDAFAAKA